MDRIKHEIEYTRQMLRRVMLIMSPFKRGIVEGLIAGLNLGLRSEVRRVIDRYFEMGRRYDEKIKEMRKIVDG